MSKPGVICPGLFAGLVNDKPAWHGDYHTNYNVEQNFWGCLAANHVELMEPYERLINEYLPRAQWIARQMYDCGGAVFATYVRVRAAASRAVPQSKRPPIHPSRLGHDAGAGQFCRPAALVVVQVSARSGTFSRNVVYPALREVALFDLDFMDTCERDKAGKVILGPTISPEHWGWTDKFKRNRNSTFDIAMFQFTFRALIEATEILARDKELADRCRALRETTARLPGQYDIA